MKMVTCGWKLQKKILNTLFCVKLHKHITVYCIEGVPTNKWSYPVSMLLGNRPISNVVPRRTSDRYPNLSVEELEIKTNGWKLKCTFSVMVGKIIVSLAHLVSSCVSFRSFVCKIGPISAVKCDSWIERSHWPILVRIGLHLLLINPSLSS